MGNLSFNQKQYLQTSNPTEILLHYRNTNEAIRIQHEPRKDPNLQNFDDASQVHGHPWNSRVASERFEKYIEGRYVAVSHCCW